MIKKEYTTEDKKLIRTLRARCSGRSHDIELYVTFMDKIMKNVFKSFAGSFSKLQQRMIDKNYFMNHCWEKLENDGLLQKLCDLTFKNDSQLKSYITKVFENLFIAKVEALSPGFTARRKQVNRVLSTRCISSYTGNDRYWILPEYKTKNCTPAKLENLMNAADSIPTPEIKFSKHPDARTPSVSDKDMEKFLLCLLERVGGAAKQADIMAVVSKKFNLGSVEITTIPSNENDEEITFEDDTILSQEHEIMAEEILKNMDEDMIDLHYYRIIREMTIAETAKKTGWSVGKVHNREKTYKEYLQCYFINDGISLLPEEAEAIMKLLSRQIMKRKGGK